MQGKFLKLEVYWTINERENRFIVDVSKFWEKQLWFFFSMRLYEKLFTQWQYLKITISSNI